MFQFLTAAGDKDLYPHALLTDSGSFNMLILLFMPRKTFLIPLPAEHFILCSELVTTRKDNYRSLCLSVCEIKQLIYMMGD